MKTINQLPLLKYLINKSKYSFYINYLPKSDNNG